MIWKWVFYDVRLKIIWFTGSGPHEEFHIIHKILNLMFKSSTVLNVLPLALMVFIVFGYDHNQGKDFKEVGIDIMVE